MREVWKQFSNDPDVGALFAEAVMDLRPWDQWTLGGQPNPGTEEILATLDAVLKLNVNHPFANHLYIHAVEASQHPERADASADRLRNLQPGLAHNVHMPSHIDIRRGRWQQAIDTNVKAVAADKVFRKIVGPPTGLLPIYAAHNSHMLEGEIFVAEKNVDAGIAELQTAVKEEDVLKYDEPPAWMIPVRHSLGAVLMKAGRYADAEQVYREDLTRLPDNGWSLYGLADSLREQKKNDDEAAGLNAKFQKTWAKADVKIATSCLCHVKK